MRNNEYKKFKLNDNELMMVAGGDAGGKYYIVRYKGNDGKYYTAICATYQDALDLCARVGVDPSTIDVTDNPFPSWGFGA